MQLQFSFNQKTDYYWKKLPQKSGTTVIMLISSLKEVKIFVIKFTINWSSVRQNCLIYYNTVIFLLQVKVDVDEVLVRLPLNDPGIPIRCALQYDVSSSCSVSNIQRKTFQEKRSLSEYQWTISNVYTYPFNP